MKMNTGIRMSAVLMAAIFGSSFAQGADGTWTNANGGTWGTAANWSGSTIANGADFTADFSTLNISADRTISLNSARTIGNLIFGDATAASNNWTLDNGGSGTNILTLSRTSGTPTITVNNQTATVSLELAGSNGLTKVGAGALVLTGANSYTGTTTVTTGTLTLGSGGSLNSGSTLAVGGTGTFNFSGAAAATQTVNGLNVTAGLGTVNNTVSGTTLTLGAITRSGSGMVDFGTTTGNINTSTANNASGHIGTWALIGNGTGLDYAVANGAGVAISSLGAATALPSAGPGAATTNYTLAGAQTQTANTVGNTLRYTGAANTLALGTTSLGLSGLMNAGTGLLTISGTAGNPGLVTAGELDIASNTQGITITSVISGAGSLVSGGVGTTVAVGGTGAVGVLVLSGANTYSGGTTISSGAVRSGSNLALGSGAVTVANGAQLQLSGFSNANTINLNGSSALFVSSGGANVLSGTVNLQSNSTLSNTTGNNNGVTLSGILNLNGNVFTVGTSQSASSATISGVINGNSSSIISKNSSGNLTISNDQTSTYSGTTSLTGGTLLLGNDGALGTGTFAIGTTAVTVRSADTSAHTFGNALTLATTTSTLTFGSGASGDLTFSNTGTVAWGSSLRTFSIANSQTQFNQSFTGTGGLTKTGTGTMVLTGANGYTGATTISAGTLLVNGSLSASSAVAVNSTGTLGGSGGSVGAVTVASGGTLSPGASVGTLNTTAVTQQAGSILKLEISTATSTSDLLNVSGALNLAATNDSILQLSILGTDVASSTSFTLVDYSTWNGGLFTYLGNVLADDSIITLGLNQYVFSYNGTNGATTAITLSAVPEPSTYALLGLGLGALVYLRRKGSQKA